jgi:hypothetical protein
LLFTAWTTSVQLFGDLLGQTGLLEKLSHALALWNAPTAPTPHVARAVVPLGPDVEARLPRGEPGAAVHITSGSRSSPHRLPEPFPSRHAPSTHGPSRADPGRRPMAPRPYPCTAPPPCRAHTVDGRGSFSKARVPIKVQELAGRA